MHFTCFAMLTTSVHHLVSADDTTSPCLQLIISRAQGLTDLQLLLLHLVFKVCPHNGICRLPFIFIFLCACLYSEGPVCYTALPFLHRPTVITTAGTPPDTCAYIAVPDTVTTGTVTQSHCPGPRRNNDHHTRTAHGANAVTSKRALPIPRRTRPAP